MFAYASTTTSPLVKILINGNRNGRNPSFFHLWCPPNDVNPKPAGLSWLELPFLLNGLKWWGQSFMLIQRQRLLVYFPCWLDASDPVLFNLDFEGLKGALAVTKTFKTSIIQPKLIVTGICNPVYRPQDGFSIGGRRSSRCSYSRGTFQLR